MIRNNIIQFCAVLLHVVEFPVIGIFADEFPLAVTNGGIAFMFPEQGTHVDVIGSGETRCVRLSPSQGVDISMTHRTTVG